MVIFEKMRLKNFLSYGNTFSEIVWNKFQNTVITSKNGNGKSTIIDALCYGLFGRAYRNINKPQLVNSVNEKECLVEVDFTIGNNKYMVRRGLKPTIFEIYINGKMIDQSDKTKDQQKYLEQNILKFSYKTFTQVVVLGSTAYTPFMELSAADRRSLVEDLLDIKVFSLMNSLAKQKISDLNKEYDTANYNISLVKEKIQLQKDNIAKQEEKKQKNIDFIKQKIKESQDIVDGLKTQLEATLKETYAITQILDGEYGKIDKEYSEISSLISRLSDKENKTLDDMLFYKNTDKCPTCTQQIDVSVKNDLIQKKQTLLEETSKAVNQLQDKQRVLQVKSEERRNKEHERHTLSIKASEISTNLHSTNKFIEKLNSELLADMSHELVDMEKLKEYEEEHLTLSTHRYDILEDQQYHHVVTTILKDSGIKTQIISQYLPVMNGLINKYLTELNFFVNFTLDEEFKEKMMSRYRDDFTYASFSEGEKFRINISLLLTWREIAKMKNSLNTNLLIFDEIFDSSLDSTGTEDVLRLIKSMTNTNVFMISHKNEIIQDKFDNVIKVEKIGNFSKMIGNE